MRYIPILFFGLLISLSGCNSNKIKRKDLIPEEKLVPILEDIHIADAIITNTKVFQQYPGRDSISHYTDILEKHGYKVEDLNRTLEYYTNNPDKLEAIYDKVIDNLSKLESEVKSARYIDKEKDAASPELWPHKKEWKLPADGKQEKIAFSIPIEQTGKYMIRAQIKMYNDDQSQDPVINAWFCHIDDEGTETTIRPVFMKVRLQKNGQWKSHILIQSLRDTTATHIKGYLLDHTDKSISWNKHADIRNISVKLIDASEKK